MSGGGLLKTALKAKRKITHPRPGHADLVGGIKCTVLTILRKFLERSSARETTMRAVVGAEATILAELRYGDC